MRCEIISSPSAFRSEFRCPSCDNFASVRHRTKSLVESGISCPKCKAKLNVSVVSGMYIVSEVPSSRIIYSEYPEDYTRVNNYEPDE